MPPVIEPTGSDAKRDVRLRDIADHSDLVAKRATILAEEVTAMTSILQGDLDKEKCPSTDVPFGGLYRTIALNLSRISLALADIEEGIARL